MPVAMMYVGKGLVHGNFEPHPNLIAEVRSNTRNPDTDKERTRDEFATLTVLLAACCRELRARNGWNDLNARPHDAYEWFVSRTSQVQSHSCR